MDFEIIIKPIVLVDLDEAMLWYESEQTGLSLRFFNAFEKTIKGVKKNPYAFLEISPHIKRVLIKKFPYKVFYTISDRTIIILGVCHAKRSNAYLRKRLRLLF